MHCQCRKNSWHNDDSLITVQQKWFPALILKLFFIRKFYFINIKYNVQLLEPTAINFFFRVLLLYYYYYYYKLQLTSYNPQPEGCPSDANPSLLVSIQPIWWDILELEDQFIEDNIYQLKIICHYLLKFITSPASKRLLQ